MWGTDSGGRKLKTRSVGIQVGGARRGHGINTVANGGVRERRIHKNAYCSGSRVVLTHWEAQERNVKPTCRRNEDLEKKVSH